VQTDRAAAMEVANRAIASVAQRPIAAGEGISLEVTASAGVAELPSDAANVAELFAAADRALYAAKARGRNRAVAAGQGGGSP
jgi:diguanylate cyclase (GGDEF)-like protein